MGIRTSAGLMLICHALAAQVLEQGREAKARLSGAETASFTVHTAPGNYLRITATSPETSVEATLLDPRNTRVAVTTSLGGTGGGAEVAGLTDSGGDYGVTLRLTRRDSTPRDVSVSIAVLVSSGSCSTVADFFAATVIVAIVGLVKPAMPLVILTLTA